VDPPIYHDPAKHSVAMADFMRALGEEASPRAPWMYTREPVTQAHCIVATSQFDCAALADLKRRVLLAQIDLATLNPETPRGEIEKLNADVREELRRYTRAVRDELPLHYYIVAPARLFGRLVSGSSMDRMFGDYERMTDWLRPFRRAADGAVWVLQVAFVAAVASFCRSRVRDRMRQVRGLVFILLTIAYFYLVHPIVVRASDFRYLVPVLPLLLMVTVSCVDSLHRRHREGA
jgi:hypothetical protein